jgi:sugar phosphate isomerase/epimerase
VKLGCSSWSYHAAFRAGGIDQMEWLRLCAEEMELDGVELVDLHFPTSDPAYLRDLKKRCTDLQLTIAGLAVSNDFGADDRRPTETQKVKQWCDVAAYLGAPIVRVFAGWVPPVQHAETPPGRIVGAFRRIFGAPRIDQRRLWSDVTYALRTATDYAADRGVTLALQNSRSEGIVGAADQIAQCVRDVGSPWLRVCLDPADLVDPGRFDAAVAHVVQVHARMRNVGDDGSDAAIHWPGLLQNLKLAHYRGFLLLDYEGGEDPTTAVPRASRYLRGLLHLLDRQRLLQQAPSDVRASTSTLSTLLDAPTTRVGRDETMAGAVTSPPPDATPAGDARRRSETATPR